MKKIFLSIAIIIGAMTFVNCSCQKSATTQSQKEVEQGELVIIYYEKGLDLTDLNQKIEQYQGKIVYQYQNLNGMAVSIPKTKTPEEAIKYFEKVKGVLQVTKNEVMELHN